MESSNNFGSIAVKIGSNVLTRPDGSLDVTRMSAIVDQIAELHHRGIGVVMISSGAVASGRSALAAGIDHPLDPVSSRQLFSAVGQARLINRYYELFREHGIACGQVLTTKENFSTRRHYLNQRHCMTTMIDNHVIPIVNENDTVSITELMFTDNDELSGLIATMLDVDALIILSNIDGIYNGNPADPQSSVIPRITPDMDLTRYISSSKSSLGRGGMTTKNRIARKVATEGIAVIIANGKRDNILLNILDNPASVPHTLFVPAPEETSGMKKWIAHSGDFAKGEIRINSGAAEALLATRAASLLPIGVLSIEGEWEKDDIVRITSPDGSLIALGRAGCDSSQAADRIGTRGTRPIVHADYIYIVEQC